MDTIDHAVWRPPPANPDLTEAAVHVWIGNVTASAGGLDRWHEVLSPDERERSERFRFEKDRVQYAACRGILRQILGQYLNTSAAEFRFRYNTHGKPCLADDLNGPDVRFNVAHSGGLAVWAFAVGREVGVDIERIRPNFATREIAERFFAPEEVQKLASLDADQQTKAFFDCWTRKEAFVKARGIGLSLPLNKFVVAFGKGIAPAVLSVADDLHASDHWRVYDLLPPPDYCAALVIEGKDVELQRWNFDAASL